MYLPARCTLRIALAVSFIFVLATQIPSNTGAQEQILQKPGAGSTPPSTPPKTDSTTNPSTQQKQGNELDGPVIVNTDLITLTVTVTDTYGRYVSGLGQKAFTILDEKQPQEITFFSDDDSPVSVGVIFDVGFNER